jgi:hypothetical protein
MNERNRAACGISGDAAPDSWSAFSHPWPLPVMARRTRPCSLDQHSGVQGKSYPIPGARSPARRPFAVIARRTKPVSLGHCRGTPARSRQRAGAGRSNAPTGPQLAPSLHQRDHGREVKSFPLPRPCLPPIGRRRLAVVPCTEAGPNLETPEPRTQSKAQELSTVSPKLACLNLC